MSELLLEILSEEIPACMILEGVENLNLILQKELEETAYVTVERAQKYSSPRRIALTYHGIKANLDDEEIKGPKINAPEAAISGFLRKYNIADISLLDIRDGIYYHKVKRENISLDQGIKRAIEKSIEKLVWPKSMRWSTHEIRWVRPIHSITCILDGKTLPVKFGHITASNITKGHRFLHSGDIEITNCDDYITKLKNADVIANYEERRQSILDQIQNIMPYGCRLKKDEELLNEVTNLVESPFVMLGSIESNFMSLPPEILIITLKENQKYMLIEDEHEKLSPHFIIVSNIPGINSGKEIIDGNQKVLQARLYDAMFFYEQDKKTPLSSLIESLKNITYHVEIGSVYDKVQSTIKMSKKLSSLFNIDEAIAAQTISISKADLVTNMVREFPELQGVMGYYYALNDGLSDEIALAIREHYKPQGPSESTPSSPLGRLVALSDKLDSIKQLFSIGIKPTSSKDPFALRRAAIGCIRIMQEQGLDVSILDELGLEQEVITFILERMKFMN